MDPLTTTFTVAFVVILIFIVQGLYYKSDQDDPKSFFLQGHTLGEGLYAESFAAASMSLAAVFMFFLTFGHKYGIAILASPISYLLGAYFYASYLVPKLDKQGAFSEDRPQTLPSYIFSRFNNSAISSSVLAITSSGVFAILLIELYIGTEIFSIFINVNEQGEGATKTWIEPQDVAIVIISLAVFFYTAFGGIKAVIATDKLQLLLMIAALIIFLGWLIYETIDQNVPIPNKAWTGRDLSLSEGVFLPYPLLINILLTNFLLVPCLLRTWLMGAAGRNARSVSSGIKVGVLITMGLSLLLFSIAILSFSGIFSNQDPSIVSLLHSLAASESPLAATLVLPIFFAACLAALLSTADSALLPIVQIITAKYNRTKNYNLVVVAVTLSVILVAIICWFIVFRVLNFNLIRWLFVIFALMITAGPLILAAILLPSTLLLDAKFQRLSLIGTWIGFLSVLVVSVVGNRTGNLDMIMLNSTVGVGIASAFLLSSIAETRRRLTTIPHKDRDQ